MVTRKVGFVPGWLHEWGEAVTVEVRLPNILRANRGGEASVEVGSDRRRDF